MDILERCNAKVTIYARTGTLSSANYPQGAYQVSAQNVPAVMTYTNGSDRLTYQAAREVRDGKAFFLPNTTIASEYRIVWNSLVVVVNSTMPVYDVDGIATHIRADWTIVEGVPATAAFG